MDQSAFKQVIDDWRERIEAFQHETGTKATSLEKKHYAIGLPTVVLGAITSSTIFSQTGGDPSFTMKVIIGVVSLCSTVLAAVMTFYSHAKRAEQHRGVASQLTNIRRALDIHATFPPKTEEEMRNKLEELNDMIAKVTDKAPTIQFNRRQSSSNYSSYGTSVMPSAGPPSNF